MSDYISRDAFKKKYLCCGYLPEMSEKEFDEFPAADVEPVRNGRWEECDFGNETIAQAAADMLFAMSVVAGRITHNSWDILEFTYVLNTLAVQHLLEDKEDKDDDD